MGGVGLRRGYTNCMVVTYKPSVSRDGSLVPFRGERILARLTLRRSQGMEMDWSTHLQHRHLFRHSCNLREKETPLQSIPVITELTVKYKWQSTGRNR